MNEGMFIALRGLGQETNSLLMQILEEQRRTNEILSQLVTLPVSQTNNAVATRTAGGSTTPNAPVKKGK